MEYFDHILSSWFCLIFPFTVFPPHPLSVRRTSTHPFSLFCDSTHLPPRVVKWWQEEEPTNDSFSLSSHLSDRQSSSYDNTLVVTTGNSQIGSTFTCGVLMQVQPYYSFGETRRSVISHTCKSRSSDGSSESLEKIPYHSPIYL